MNLQKNFNILVVGGGSAGWMTANLFAKKWAHLNVTITLIESKEIGIIGVGEASLPKLKTFFDQLGLSEKDWMPHASATYKNSIKFTGWSEDAHYRSYHHPFPTALDSEFRSLFEKHCSRRMNGENAFVHPDHYFLASYLSEKNLSPRTFEKLPYWVSYGYHLDTYLIGKFLSKNAQKLKVCHIIENVTSVSVDESNSIKSVNLANGRSLTADLFVDCSGSKSLLLQETMGVKFESYSDYLLNDSAVVAQIPNGDSEVKCYTESTAMKFGWRWSIPLLTRTGNGYVYSSKYCSPDQAEREFGSFLKTEGSATEFRHLKMKIGRASQAWFKNCVAIGLSQGFIEPLESSGLYIIQETIENFIEAFEKGNYSSTYQNEFNEKIKNMFERIRDYVSCHYKLSSRNDTSYWTDCQNLKVSDAVQIKLEMWNQGRKLHLNVIQEKDIFPSLSWYCLFAGYGLFPMCPRSDVTATQLEIQDIEQQLKMFSEFFKSHKIALSEVHRQVSRLEA